MSGWGSMSKVEAYVIHWREENGGAAGEGISRTSDPNARLFPITVEYKGMQPMREWIKATTKEEALKFANNRYPTATKITLNPKTNDKRTA